MNTYIAMLRGINVSGQKLIKMEALRAMCEALGFKHTQTYIQSGNIIFQTKQTAATALEKKIATAIKKDFGHEVPVMVKELEELQDIWQHNTFVTKRKEDITKIHVTFLDAAPDAAGLTQLKTVHAAPDEWLAYKKAIYLFCPGGYGNTKLNNNLLEQKLKRMATTRNWKTLAALIALAGTMKDN
jgi:uncharacterized protein (DUF1697 family)